MRAKRHKLKGMVIHMKEKIKNLYRQWFRDTDVDRRIYNWVLTIAIISLAIIIIVEAGMQYEWDGLMAMIVLLLYLVIMFILANMYPHKLKLLFSFITVPINLAVFPFMFLLAEGGGIRSGMSVWMAMGLLLLFMTADGFWFVLQVIVTVMVDFFLFLASYLNPDMIKEVDNPFYYYEDNLIAICIVSLCIGFMIRYQRKVLESQNGKIEQTLAQIRQEKRRTEKISAEKDKIMEDLSYNVRTPLNIIVGMSDMAKQNIEDTDKVKKCLDKISESSWQMLQIMNRILRIGEYGTKNYLDPDELISHCEDGRLYRDADGALMLNARNRNILVVEDNDINVEIIENILQKTYAKVTCAKTAEEAIQLIEASGEFEYDLILMDIQLPGMDGYCAARSIRSMDRADAIVLPVLAMTADALTQDVDKALQCGMNAHIAKPIIVEELYTKLYYYLFVAKIKII